MRPPDRKARLVLVTEAGDVLGVLPPLAVATPWWQDIAPVVAAAHDAFGVDVTVLRVLDAEDAAQTGEVTYLAQAERPGPAAPWTGRLESHPLRLSYAELGGPARDVAWALDVLSQHRRTPTGPPVQIRTWNLSSLWRIPLAGGDAWLKVVPPFFAHEGAMLEALSGERAPRLIARDGTRMLMPEIPGGDLYEATQEQRLAMVRLLTDLQGRWIGRAELLFALGAPDWSAAALSESIADVFERTADQLSEEERAAVAGFIGALPGRLAALASCGLPDTLVHGDFHPGNVRGQGLDLTLLDWGDCGYGHPLLDQAAFLERADEPMRGVIEKAWSQAWRTIVPGCDPDRAAALIAPISAARRAVVYQAFLDQIEPAEHPYHRSDPAMCLRETASLVRAQT